MTELSAKHLRMLGCKVELDTNLDVNHCNKCSTSVQTVRTMADHDSNYECHSYVLNNFTSEDYTQLSAVLEREANKENEKPLKVDGIGGFEYGYMDQMVKGQANHENSCVECGTTIFQNMCPYCSKCCTDHDCLVHSGVL
jgi:hypothetical protein